MADVNGDGVAEVLTAPGAPLGSLGPINAFSMTTAGFTPFADPVLSGFNGFGFFGNEFLAASTFAAPAAAAPVFVPTPFNPNFNPALAASLINPAVGTLTPFNPMLNPGAPLLGTASPFNPLLNPGVPTIIL